MKKELTDKKLLTKMKSLINLIASFAIVSASFSQSNELPYIDFRIDNIESIGKIIITENTGAQFVILRKDNLWTDRYGDCISQYKLEQMLEAFKKIEFKGYLSEQQTLQYSNRDSISKMTVEIFQDGVNTKTWYFGPPSAGNFGQIMYVKSIGRIDKAIPVIMNLKEYLGTIETRFFTNPKQWKCTTVYSVSAEDIAKVVVVNNENHEKSFSIEKNQNVIRMYNQNKLLSTFDTTMLYRYLGNFKKIDFESTNFSLSQKQIDSIKNSIPFAEITVTTKLGFSKTIKCYRINSYEGGIVENNYDTYYFWCELPPFGEIVMCNQFMLNPIFNWHMYFPSDISTETQQE